MKHDATPDPARLACLHALTKVREDDAYANLVLPKLLDQARLDRRDAAFATALTYGALRLQGRYDAVIAACVDRPLERIDAVVLDVLRLGAHQLLGMRVPTHAAVSTSVDLAAYSAGRGAAGFVNAVMRRIDQRDLDGWLDELRRNAPDEVTALARTHSHPQWMVKALRQALKVNDRPAAELEALLAADNTEPQVALCARPGLIDPDELAEQVRAATGADTRPGDLSPQAIVLSGGDPSRIQAVRDSRAGVEDEASQLVALMLAAAPLEGADKRWLDLCAGPGGKAALLGALAATRGATLVANEIADHRTGLVQGAVRALPDGVVQLRTGDGRDLGRQESGAYDRILVDAPCSGLGSLRRRPEARWRRTPQDVAALAELQRELLLSAAVAVRPGGVVAYVTCTPHVLETSLVVRDVTRQAARAGVRLEPLHAGHLAAELAPRPPAGADREMLQTWPHLDDSDAMFCALLRRAA
ncbi:RsmB/NOP family class I SAM-dependent RNA methyltransferase [Actinomyces qiguomingii]|uniref:RsmB/NOP family class I SAM-dependent RNA methyltransferase n=1 Tax=Actinomyces qiguomingii TaxID=2057800 RepID=UPI000CA0685B|nr:transcription antitermination factor NusB [Actinomyces qiguomingii]